MTVRFMKECGQGGITELNAVTSLRVIFCLREGFYWGENEFSQG